MATNTSSISDYLLELGVDVNNMQEFLNKLSQILSTKSDTVTVTQTLQDGTTKDFLVPSFGYLSTKVNNIESQFNLLLSGNANELGIKDPAGNLRTFEVKDIVGVVSQLENISTLGVALPSTFNYKTNWFFESFLNPLLYVNIDTATIVSDADINRFEAKRLIITSKIQSDTDYFDTIYKGKTNLVYEAVVKDLSNRGITFYEDSTMVELDPAQNTVRGTFDILAILEDSTSDVVGGQTLTTAIRKYKLNTLRYNELTATSSIERTLQAGDIVISKNNTEFIIRSVDVNQRSVILEITFGLDGLAQGAKALTIKPKLQRDTHVQINLGYNERNIIFLKPISDRLAITTDKFSQGFGIYTNDLTITMNNGTQLSLAQFYQNFVSDFGMLFMSYAKEKKLPSVVGEIPNGVTIASSNFKVIHADQHIQDADNTAAIKQKISAKEQAASQIKELDKQISDTRANLNTNSALNESQKLKLQKDLTTYANTRATLTNTQKSLIADITSSIASTPSFITNPTYKVRGFWAIPDPVDSSHGKQQVVQFKVSYRSLSKTGNSKTPDQIAFTDQAGNKVTGAFSPWTEFATKARTKKYNSTTGFYEWADESVSDPNVVNSNQVDIPIKKGEIIEIRIKSLSEAGWPDSPVESDWSNSIQVEFPADIETSEDSTIVSQQAFADQTRISFQDELNAKGLDIHLSTAFTNRDKYYAHKSEDIASGFFANDGSIIDLYSKIKALTDALAAVQTSIATAKGQLSVMIIDGAGNQRAIANGQTVDLFAGYYKDFIKDTSSTPVTYNHGKIVTIQYLLQIQNTSQTPLQLISTLNGGIGESAPISNPTAYPTIGYHTSLRYDLVPINLNTSTDSQLNSIYEKDGYQSSQVKSQFIYSRYKDVKIANDLYKIAPITSTVYNYRGTVISANGTLVPFAGGHYLPIDPTFSIAQIQINGYPYNTSTNANVWNGAYSGTATGGGTLTEFCIHKDHPGITGTWASLSLPTNLSGDTVQKYLPFSQGVFLEVTEGEVTGPLGSTYYQQASRVTPTSTSIPNTSIIESQFPVKNGFSQNDEYLVGKYTCGAYLTLNPASYNTISVDGISATGSYKLVQYGVDSSIKIPITFQFRASDKLQYIGGWRADKNGGLKNVKYTKKLGIDIYTADSPFSFDLSISAQYEKDTAVVTPITAISQSGVGGGMLYA